MKRKNNNKKKKLEIDDQIKSSKFSNIALIVLSLLFIVLVIYELFIYEEKPLEYSEEEITSYFSRFGQCNLGYNLELTNNTILKYEDLPKEFVNNTLYNYLNYIGNAQSNKEEDFISKDDPKIDSFYKKDLEDAVKHIYGDVKYDLNKTFVLEEDKYYFDYDSKEEKYTSTRTKPLECVSDRIYGYAVDTVRLNKKELYVDILYYNYLFDMKAEGCYRFIFSGKDGEELIGGSLTYPKNNKEHFLKYRFVFVPNKELYIFDHVELVK